MLLRKPSDVAPSEITSEATYLDRRTFLAATGGLLAASALPARAKGAAGPGGLGAIQKSPLSSGEAPNTWQQVTTYNNFYEFGLGKDDPAREAWRLKARPWEVKVTGLCAKPRTFGIEELLKLAPLEERIYRMRCVEGWSMVIPWVGFPLKALLDQVQPLGSARFVALFSAARPDQMPGVRIPVLDWPYLEGLRLDEAYHPLAILAVGLYGQVLPNQNGAPIRLVVPWKYGFKGAKSIVEIRLVKDQPWTSWPKSNPDEYGFYANVNPHHDHPRWSQKTERRIGELLRRPTQMFNGYGDQVAHLYAGMDLDTYY
ncbi:MAG TPA: protein-methionine-sulfoxide reductase catalytic subunit MsrP [Holophagaceae bacterium]|nr:protein-methionine-sulfoxide reductase catalytic subunit MsrP [Holophagaceae bacterium]